MALSKTGFLLLLCCFLTVQAFIPAQRITVLKRSTMLLNRLMNALNKTFQHESISVPQMELHRRGEEKMYWKCYFNAVSCFRRK